MGNVIKQRYHVYDYEQEKDRRLQRGEMIFVENTPDFGENIVRLAADGKKTVESLYESWKNGEGVPFRTATAQDTIDAEIKSSVVRERRSRRAAVSAS